jgi:hypothetical protein
MAPGLWSSLVRTKKPHCSASPRQGSDLGRSKWLFKVGRHEVRVWVAVRKGVDVYVHGAPEIWSIR